MFIVQYCSVRLHTNLRLLGEVGAVGALGAEQWNKYFLVVVATNRLLRKASSADLEVKTHGRCQKSRGKKGKESACLRVHW